MIDLKDYLTEGNISNTERKFREFSQMCAGYNTSVEEVRVHKTSKGNWAVYKDNRRVFTASTNILDSTVVETYKIKLYEA